MVNKPPAKQETWIPSLGDSIPGRSPREGNSNQLQSSCLENSMDRGAIGSQKSDVTEHAHIHRAGEDPEHLEFHS